MLQLRYLLGDALNARYVAAQAHDGGVGDAADPLRGEGLQLADGIGHAVVLTAPLGRVVLLHVGIEDEDVLVHVGRPEVGGVDRTPDGLNGCQLTHSFRSPAETLLGRGAGRAEGADASATRSPSPASGVRRVTGSDIVVQALGYVVTQG